MSPSKKQNANRDCRYIFAGMLSGVLCGLLLTGCLHAAPPMLDAHTAEISGNATRGRNPNDATEIVLFKAAAMTLDHGFRYFRITGADSTVAGDNALIRPGANVTIRVYREGEINPRSTGIVDAEEIAQNDRRELSRVQAQSPSSAPPRSSANAAAPAPMKSGMPAPHCTVYGCTW